MFVRLLGTMMVVAIALATNLSTARAADDTAQFLDAMRNRGYFDIALEYLDSVGGSGVASDEFKARVPYERGMTLIGKWRRSASSAERARLANQIESELNNFAKANPDSPLAGDAKMQLGQMMLESASRTLYNLRQRPQAASREAELRAEAFQGFRAARKAFSDVEASITASLAKFPKTLDPKTQSAEIDRRRDFREQLGVVRVLRSFTLLESAEALGKDHADYVKTNEQAAAEFQEHYDKYGTYMLAAQSRVYQGQCYLNVGKLKEASGCFEDVIVSWGEAPNARAVVTKAHAYQAECYIIEKKYQDVVTKQGAWLAKAERGEVREPEWIRLKYQVAEAKRLLSAGDGVKDATRKKLVGEARDLYGAVALIPGEYQKRAQERLGELGGAEDSAIAPKTFDEALQAAKEAIVSTNSAKQAFDEAKKGGEDTAAIAQQLDEGIRSGTRHLQLALALVDDDTPLAKVNEVRRLLSGLFWQDEQYYRAAVLASFLARRYPEDPSSASAAQVALASYQKLYQGAVKDGDSEAGRPEAERLKDLAGFITRRWSKHPLADTAFSVLLNFSINERRYNVALELVKELEQERQPYFTARIANAMWEAQLKAMVEDGDSPERQQLRQQSIQLLKQTYEPLKQDRAAANALAATSLYLTQALLDDGDYVSAIRVLEDPKGGPLALAKTSNPIASRPVYVVEAYKCALRAYVSVVPPQSDKALEAMASLEEAVGKTDGGGDKLTKVYLGLGLQLQKQIEQLQQAGNTEEALRVGQAFVAFLDKLNERGTSDPTIARWIAQTYYKLAEGLEGDTAAETDRKSYYTKARDAFKGLIDTVKEPKVKLALQMQYAQSLRKLGDYQQAMALFEEVLTEKEMLLDLQKAAAYTLQEWGATNPSKFDEAIRGTGATNERGKHVVWGWSYLGSVASQVMRTKPEFRPLFYECWLNQARIRTRQALDATGAEKTRLLKSARSVISTMVNNYSDFLNTELRGDFDTLMKEIQQAEGKRPTGLEEFGVSQ